MFRKGRRIFALGRLKSGEMNKTEAAYELTLKALKQEGKILEYWFEGITLKLADGCRYTADFMVLLPNGELELHEVKGARAVFYDDAKVKVKIAAKLFPFRVKVVFPIPKKLGGGWEIEDYSNKEEENG